MWWCVSALVWAAPSGADTWTPRDPVSLVGRHPAPFTLANMPLKRLGSASQAAGVRASLLAHLREQAWPAIGAEDQGPDRTAEARLVLDGEIRVIDRVVRNGVRGLAIEVWWQLVDRRHDAVLYEVSTLGWAPSGAPEAVVQSALDQVLARPRFLERLEEADRRAFHERGSPIALRPCVTDEPAAPVVVGRGAKATAGVVISPDGYVWTSASRLPVPPEPVLVRTPRGRTVARWVAADADADVALLALVGDRAADCTPLAQRIPLVAESVAAWQPRGGAQLTAVAGFRLHEEPSSIVVDTIPGSGAVVVDRAGALVGFSQAHGSEARVQPHRSLRRALRVHWSREGSHVPPLDEGAPVVDDPDPGFVRPTRR